MTAHGADQFDRWERELARDLDGDDPQYEVECGMGALVLAMAALVIVLALGFGWWVLRP